MDNIRSRLVNCLGILNIYVCEKLALKKPMIVRYSVPTGGSTCSLWSQPTKKMRMSIKTPLEASFHHITFSRNLLRGTSRQKLRTGITAWYRFNGGGKEKKHQWFFLKAERKTKSGSLSNVKRSFPHTHTRKSTNGATIRTHVRRKPPPGISNSQTGKTGHQKPRHMNDEGPGDVRFLFLFFFF